jgi:histidine ammonia-lyase
VHVLVYMAFGPRELREGDQVNHGPDTRKSNNCIENLTAVSAAEHVAVAHADNLKSTAKMGEALVALVRLVSTSFEPLHEHVGECMTTRAFGKIVVDESREDYRRELTRVRDQIGNKAVRNGSSRR